MNENFSRYKFDTNETIKNIKQRLNADLKEVDFDWERYRDIKQRIENISQQIEEYKSYKPLLQTYQDFF